MKTSAPYTTEAVSRSGTAPSTSRQLSAPRLICRCQQQARPLSGTPSASACNLQVRTHSPLSQPHESWLCHEPKTTECSTYPNHPEFLTRMQHFGPQLRAQWQRQLAICKSWTSSPPNRRCQACMRGGRIRICQDSRVSTSAPGFHCVRQIAETNTRCQTHGLIQVTLGLAPTVRCGAPLS